MMNHEIIFDRAAYLRAFAAHQRQERQGRDRRSGPQDNQRTPFGPLNSVLHEIGRGRRKV